MPINDDNTLYNDSYQLVNLKLGYKFTINNSLKLDLYSGFNNIFDIDYASQIRINAPSFGGNPARYYYPGNPFNYYSGVVVSYEF